MLDTNPGLAAARSALGQVTVTPTQVEAGQTFLVEVKAEDGSSHPDQHDRVTIGGLVTPRRYMSFRRPGNRSVIISVRGGDNGIERIRVPIEVLPASRKRPSLEIEPALEDGARVRFRVSFPAKLSRTDEERPGNLWRRETSRVVAKRARHLKGDEGLSRKERSKVAESARAFVSAAAEAAAQRAAASFVAAAAHAAVAQAARVTAASGGTRVPADKAGSTAAAAAASATLASARALLAYVPPNLENELGKTTYTWDFGAGPFVSTSMPSFTYDFEPRLDMTRPRTIFHVKVEVREPGQKPYELMRTISVANPYHPSRVKGVIRPIVRGDVNAVLVMDSPRHYRASLEVVNLEKEAITLGQHQFEPLYLGDPPDGPKMRIEARAIGDILRKHLDVTATPKRDVRRVAARSRFFTSRPIGATMKLDVSGDWIGALVTGHAVAIPPGATQKLEVRLPYAALPKHAVGFAVHYRGTTARGKQVRASAYFDIPGRFPRVTAVDASIATTLKPLIDHGLLPRGKPIRSTELATLSRRSAPPSSLRRADLERVARPGIEFDGLSDPVKPLSGNTDELVEGGPCDPYNLPPVIPEGWVCQATAEKEWRWVPPRFVNARQGDIILSPGGDGLIAQLLRQVDPPQSFSHSGIMSRNQTEVTHSTASESRLLSYPEGSFDEPTDGLQPEALRFLWPGVVRQTVEQAVDGQPMEDPQGEPDENGKKPTYTIHGFNPDFSGGNGEVTPALVVKPDPFEETPQVRAKLREIGAFAGTQHRKGHYRFFAYTDPTVVLSTVGPESADWAAGTYPCVCSSFIWFCARGLQTTFEGNSLEPDDLESAVKVDLPESGEDGLYRYTAEERLTAGEFIYQWLYDMVWDSAEGFEDWVVFFSDMADDVANQVLNTFESDWAETDARTRKPGANRPTPTP